MEENSEQTRSKSESNITNKIEGYLEIKAAGGLFSGFKKYYFVCLEEKTIIYTQNQESKQVLGYILISNISFPEIVDQKTFQFRSIDNKVFIFRAASEEERDKWVLFITEIFKVKKELEEVQRERERTLINSELSVPRSESRTESIERREVFNDSIVTMSKRIARIIKNYGFFLNPEEVESNAVLKDKGIDELINLNDPKVKSRIHYGFLFKKHKSRNYFQKRWFFIFSSRPLYNKEYIQDDADLDIKKQKDWVKFDTLYYFKSNKNAEYKDNLGALEMVNSHKILEFENNKKYYINLDVGDRIYDFYCDYKFERDIWFEVLKNSRRTAKEYFASKTKKPRNVELLNLYFQKGEKDFIKKLESEKKSIVGNYDKIKDFEVFAYNQNALKESILSTIDGCLSNTPPKKDLLKAYAEYMSKEYLEMTKYFWENFYDTIGHADILKMSMFLLTFRDSLLELNVEDENLLKNGKELIKIYYKKTYQNILSVIESILNNELDVKGIKTETGELKTQGPGDLFEILSSTFDLIKENKNKTIYRNILLLFKEALKQYLVGIDSVLTNLNIIIDNEYLIAMANNSFNLINLLNDLIDCIKKMDVLTQKEISDIMQSKKLMYTINKVSQNSITIFVSQFRLELGKEFKNINYMDLKMENVLVKTNEIFSPYKSLMNILIVRKCWNEILQMTLYHYISCLLTTANKTNETVEEIREKINFDKGILLETYEPVVGRNLVQATLKIMSDINDFLNISSYMISSSCLTLKQYIGSSFSLSTVKALIKLRTDFSYKEKEDALEQCKEILDNYKEPVGFNTGGYFQYMEKELKKQEREEKKQEMQKLNEIKNTQQSSNLSLIFSSTFLNFNSTQKEGEANSDPENDEEEEVEKPIINMELSKFLEADSDEDEEKNNEDLEEMKKIEVEDNDNENQENEEISDIDLEGYMYKKSHTNWQKRYFQLKNGNLYWFENKKSSIIKNKIALKDTEKIVSHKDKKFLMIVKIQEEEKGTEFMEKEYKFRCETEDEKRKWILALTNSMKEVNKSENLKNEEKLDIKIRKKVIKDLFKLPEIHNDTTYMRNQVLDAIEREHYFKPSARKIEEDKVKAVKAQEERKIREKLEEEKRKQEEKEKRKKEEMERDKQIEKDIKEGKDVGVTDRIKFWFKGLGKDEENQEGNDNKNVKKEDVKAKEEEDTGFNINDFINGGGEE